MNRLFSYFIILMAFGFISLSCSNDDNSCSTNEDCKDGQICISEECKVDDSKSSLTFLSLNDGDFIDGYRYDEDGIKDGVQVTIHINANDINENTDVTLMIDGDETSKVTEKLKVLDDGSSIAKFSKFTLKNGSNKLVLQSVDKNGKDVKTEITITAQELTLEITSPLDGTTLTKDDDQNPDEYYIQKDVTVNVKGLVAENTLLAKLILFSGDDAKYSYVAEPKNGVVVFENVDFRAGDWKIVASIDTRANATISSLGVNLTAESVGDCNVSILPETGTLVNMEYLEVNNIQNKEIPLYVESNCPVGFKVKFTLNGTEIYSGILVEKNGKSVAETKAVLPEDTENGGNSELRVDVAQDFNTPGSDGGFNTATYIVDTIPPVFVEVTDPLEDSILNTDTDLDGNPDNGIQFWVKGKVTDSTSLLKVYINDINNPVGGIQTYENAIISGEFDTSTLADNQYTTISVDGEATIIFEAIDEHGNKSTFNRAVMVILNNPNQLSLSFGNSKYLNPKNFININNESVSILMSKYLEGVLSLDVTLNGAPYDYTDTIIVNNPDDILLKYFSLENLGDGRYVFTPKFKDTNEFNYSGVNGYLNVKTSKPSFSNFNIVQDTDNDNILNMAKDVNANLDGFQTDIEIETAGLYLDDMDCEAGNTVKATLLQGSLNGAVLGTSENIACDNKVTFTNVTLPEGNYKVYFKITDNFGNSGDFESPELTVDVTAPNIDTIFLTATTGGVEKTIATDEILLLTDDKDPLTEGLQSDFKGYSNDSATIRIKVNSIDSIHDINNGMADFGELTLNNGVNNIELTATDNVGNQTVKNIDNITVDTLIPVLTFSMSKTTVIDSDDEDTSRPGIQITGTVSDMENIENNQKVYIQKGVDDGNGSFTWNNITNFTKDTENTKDIVITVPLGNYKLRAFASDINLQEGYSSELDMDVTSSACAIVSVKKGNTELVSGDNYFNSNDVVDGKVSFTVTYTASCSALGGTTLTAEKNGAPSGSVEIDATLTSVLEVPFANLEHPVLTFKINSTPDEAHSSFLVLVDTDVPTISRVTPSNENVIYVNRNNPDTGNNNKIADLNEGQVGAQVGITVNVLGAEDGKVEMLGNNDAVIATKNNLASDDESPELFGTLTDNTSTTIKFRVTDKAGNVATEILYNAVVDVTNPGDLATLGYDALTDTQRRTAELNLTWDQSGTDDVVKYIIKYSTTLFDENAFEGLDGSTNKEIIIDNPDLSTDDYQKIINSLMFQKEYAFGVRAYDEVGNAGNILIKNTGTDLNLQGVQLDTSGFNSNERFGKVKPVGDINNDGIDDFVVTQPDNENWDGEIFIYYGTDDVNTISTPQVIKGAPGSGEGFGESITSGDFDGDGKTDLLIGAAWADVGYTGGVYVFYNQGDDNGTGQHIDPVDKTFIKNPSASNARFGESVANIGKIDNKDCFVIGQDNSSDGGRAYLIQGRANKPAEIDIATANKIVELSHDFGTDAGFGASVSGLGDMDNNGVVDLVVGDFTSQKVALFYLESTVFSSTTLIAKASNDGSGDAVVFSGGTFFGKGVIGDIDLNNDGNKDLVISSLSQGLTIYYGSGSQLASDSTSTIIYEPSAPNNQTNWNTDVAVADLNGDNKDDIVVSAKKQVNIYLSKTNNFTNGTQPDIILDGVNDFEPDFTDKLKIGLYDVNDDTILDIIVCDEGTKNCFIKY